MVPLANKFEVYENWSMKCNCPWQHSHAVFGDKYYYEKCGLCGRIREFHWRSFWKGLSELIK